MSPAQCCIHCGKQMYHEPVSTLSDVFLFSCKCLMFKGLTGSYLGYEIMVDLTGTRSMTRIMWDDTVRFYKYPFEAQIETFGVFERTGRWGKVTATIKAPFPYDIETVSLDKIKQFVRMVVLMS